MYSSQFCGKRKSRIITITIIIIYMFITGFSPSVVRAAIMGTIMLGGGILYRKSDVWTSIAVSLLIILFYNPFLISSLSVLLSYGGVIGIIVFNKTIVNLLEKIKIKDRRYKYKITPTMKKIIKYLREIFAVAISAQIIIMPIMAMNFSTVGIAFCITNVVISIIIGPIVILGFVAIVLSIISIELLKIISYVLNPFLQATVLISNLGNNLPLNKIYIGTPGIIQIIVYYVTAFAFNYLYKVYLAREPNSFQYRVRNLISLFKYNFRQNRKKIISSLLIICIIFSLFQIIPQDLKIYFIDVGQGDSTLIITPMKQSILIDGGGSLSSSYDVGKSTLLPYLLDRGITKLNYIFVSHFDQDHVRRAFICNARNRG